MATNEERKMVKVSFEVKDYSPGQDIGEHLWAEDFGEGLYEIRNTPFFVYDVSFEDVVQAVEDPSGLVFREVVKKSGNRTIRFLNKMADTSREAVKAFLRPFNDLGCTAETGFGYLYAMNIPADADLSQVLSLLGESGISYEVSDGEEFD